MTEIPERDRRRTKACFRPAVTIDHGMRSICYAVVGDRGPWLIANSLGNDTGIYIPALYQNIAANCRIIVVRWPQTNRLESAVKDNIAVLDTIGVDAATWYGSSVGGAIAQTANLLSPQHVSGMILANTALPVSWARGLARFAGYVIGLFPEKYLRRKLVQGMASASKADEREAASTFLTKIDICRWLRWAADFHGLNLKRLPKHDRGKPVLILETDNDPGVPPSHRQKLKLFYAQATVTCFEDGGHFPQGLFPEQYEREISDFLKATDSESSDSAPCMTSSVAEPLPPVPGPGR